MIEEAAENEVLHQVVLVLVSAAFLTVVAMTTFLCGFCNICKWSSSNGEEQKQPILGMEESRNPPSRGASYAEAGIRPSLTSQRSKTLTHVHVPPPSSSQNPAEAARYQWRRSPQKSWPSVIFGPRQATFTDSGVPFENSDDKMVVEAVQPESKGIKKQSSVMSASSAFSLAQEALGLTETAAPPDEPTEFVGKLQFSIKYEFTDETLIVKIFKATDLLAKDFSGTSDPFVKVMLLPNKKHKMETKVKRKKLNPVWNETFLFEGFPYSKLQERILHLEVLDYDRFSRNDPIGELNIPLVEIDLTQEQTIYKSLIPSSKSAGKLGKILVSLCFAPTAGRITIVIMKCEGLAAKDITGKSDPYVKVWHVFQEKKIEKKKTIVKYNTLNPVFNVSFMFHVTLNKIRDTSFIISVIDKDRLSRNDTIGGIILGPKASPSETGHWAEMLNKPRTPVAQWHDLKDMG